MPFSRVFLLLVLLFASAGAAFAEGDPASGEAAYAATCARCHASVARTVRRIDGDTPEEKAAWLAAFLADHFAPDETLRADLIAFLLTE